MLLSWFALQSSLCGDKWLVTRSLNPLSSGNASDRFDLTLAFFVSSSITLLSLPSLPQKDIIRQPSEDEIIKLAPPPKKAWGGNRKHWSLHLGFFAPTNWPTPPLPRLSRNDTKNNPPTTQNQSDRRDAAASRAEGRWEKQTGGEEIWRWEKQCRSVRREPKIWVGQVRVSATCELFDLWCCVYATVCNVCERVYVCVYAACKANLSLLKHPRLHRSRLLDFSFQYSGQGKATVATLWTIKM